LGRKGSVFELQLDTVQQQIWSDTFRSGRKVHTLRASQNYITPLMLKKLSLFLIAIITPLFASAQESGGVDAWLQEVFEPITAAVESVVFAQVAEGIPFVLPWLIVGATVFTIYMGFVNITAFKHALDVVRGKYDDPDDEGEVSHFQALTAALSGTVGVGNIAGVAAAVSLGGPGATFWMILAGILGMTSKFTEVSLGLMYRNVNEDGSVSGGPMYYLDKGLKEKGWGTLGKVLAVMFAIFCIGGSFGGGNMVQINQATSQLIAVTGGDASFLAGRGWIFGTIMAVVIGDHHPGWYQEYREGHRQDRSLHGRYLHSRCPGGAWLPLFTDIPGGLWSAIFSGALTSEAMYGGFIGVLIQGFRRSAFSNEAG
jgi:AGCS family alanine or glycine:cation symporter